MIGAVIDGGAICRKAIDDPIEGRPIEGAPVEAAPIESPASSRKIVTFLPFGVGQ
jgi:hypothetical protein